MAILDLYNKSLPKTGKIDTKGKDKQPIESSKENDATLAKARGGKLKEAKYDSVGGKLQKFASDTKLAKARGGALNSMRYSDTFKNK
jgi:hypothetical protein